MMRRIAAIGKAIAMAVILTAASLIPGTAFAAENTAAGVTTAGIEESYGNGKLEVALPVKQSFITETGAEAIPEQAWDYAVELSRDSGDAGISQPSFRMTKNGEMTHLVFSFPHAGVYEAALTQAGPGDLAAAWSQQTKRFTLRFYVRNTENGGLTATMTGEKDNGQKTEAVEFVDAYNPAVFTLPVRKDVKNSSGGNYSTDERFYFTAESADGPLPGNVSGPVQAYRNGAGTVTFEPVVLEKEGTYHYNIRETAGTNDEMKYDSTVYTVAVTVARKDGKLAVEKSNYTANNPVVITNTYQKSSGGHSGGGGGGGGRSDRSTKPKPMTAPPALDVPPASPVSVDPPVTKIVNGDTPKTAQEFRFALKADDPSYPMPEGSSNGIKYGSIVGAGSFEFGTITYTVPGTYSYTASEVNTGNWAYRYDKSIFHMTVTVTENNGALAASVQITKDGAPQESMTFVNTYSRNIVRRIVRTGDSSHVLAYGMIAATALLLLIVYIRRKKSEKAE